MYCVFHYREQEKGSKFKSYKLIGGLSIKDIHNHTIYSDGDSTPEEIIQNAIKNGLNTVGISDHNRALFFREPEYECLYSYINEINMLKQYYRNDIEVLIGIELNLNFEYDDEIDTIPFDIIKTLDYVLLEHVDGTAPSKPVTQYCISLKDIGIIREKIMPANEGLAHTDLLELAQRYNDGMGISKGIAYVVGMLKKFDLFWELNIDPDREYFDYMLLNWNSKKVGYLFNKLKENDISIYAGSDTHILRYFNMKRVRTANAIADYQFGN